MSDLAAIKERQQQTWASGDYAVVASHIAPIGDALCEAVDIVPGSRVLDVACGSGNAALAAARRFCHVIGVDYVPSLLTRARERAAAERLEIDFREGDAESLPFPDASFDVVLSTFGVMFAPDQERAAAELLRVCRPGAKIGLTSWTSEGFSGQIFALTSRYLPPPPGLRPPSRWGSESGMRELFDDGVSDVQLNRRVFMFRFLSPDHWLQFFRTNFGPTIRAFETLDDEKAQAYANDLLNVIAKLNRATDGTAIFPGEYLEVVATRA